MRRTQKEIDIEINGLKALQPKGKFAPKTAMAIAFAIDELEGRTCDQSDDEFFKLEKFYQGIIKQTRLWLSGDTAARPSQDWGELTK